ncbi:ribosome biogenesis protein Rrp14-C [Schizosaccharomyces japonicus yFS275]|uniref:Ribosome biogenesis protein Rrp14-C n=1 Tax=Schizosaccharomyces japonicus (strain yFS275 / FY16936) TaxID=402676 RepID=B6K757_SCHJY|nr:ribosome biogenesis protein Rrp14-C [Schizosaccharomyces japonicus yFS275]EEB09361.1 ribosome biogenesis protein Rrp14-C [Schizosaccharomyces japonicus yFS275]
MGAESDELRSKLAARIQELRAKRKAPEQVNRQALIEARKAKAKARIEAKRRAKEQSQSKQENKEDAKEIVVKEESSEINSVVHYTNEKSRSVVDNINVSYGKLLVGDEAYVGDKLKGSKKKKGPTDVYGALKHLEAKERRLSKLETDKVNKIKESDSWHRALLQAEGKKMQDNEHLLKKTVKRKEAAKKKSAKEWKERLQNIEKAQALRQKRREENLQKRRESRKTKGSKSKKKKKSKKAGFH